MSDTERKNYRGEEIAEGEHAKKCPELNCEHCVNGKSKRTARRKARHDWKPTDD